MSSFRSPSFVLLSILLVFRSSLGQIPDNSSGYVDVRPSAHMFWWLYGSTNPSVPREQLPLVMWLQVCIRKQSVKWRSICMFPLGNWDPFTLPSFPPIFMHVCCIRERVQVVLVSQAKLHNLNRKRVWWRCVQWVVLVELNNYNTASYICVCTIIKQHELVAHGFLVLEQLVCIVTRFPFS